MPPVLRKLAAVLISLPLPPLGVWLARGWGGGTILTLLLFVAAQGVFWFFAAGPGVALWAASILLAVLLSLFASQTGSRTA